MSFAVGRIRRLVDRPAWRLVSAGLLVGLLAGLWGESLWAQRDSFSRRSGAQRNGGDVDAVEIDPAVVAIQKAMVDAIAHSEKSVVAIARGAAGSQSLLMVAGRTPPDFATGVVIDANGLILTNQHVVGDPARHDYVVWIDRHAYQAKVKAANPYYDLAVLQIDAAGLSPVTFGDTSALKKGQLVLALGDPWAIAGDGSPSASWGILSHLNRLAPPDSTDEMQDGKATLYHFGGLIQTDARLQRGTSGGALLNLKGELIGITTSLAALEGGQQAAGYAIRIDDRMREVIERLKQGLDVEVGLLGISPETPWMANQKKEISGVRVARVIEGTGAAAAGLRPGDLITHVNQQPVSDRNALFYEVSQFAAGETAHITARRGRRHRTVKLDVVLSKKRLTTRRVAVVSRSEPSWRGMRVEYCSAVPPVQRQGNAIDPAGCVAVVEVRRDSPAWQAGLREGCFISHVFGRRVSTPTAFRAAVAGRMGEVVMRLTAPIVGRDESTTEVRVSP